jgi:hypothetical protein
MRHSLRCVSHGGCRSAGFKTFPQLGHAHQWGTPVRLACIREAVGCRSGVPKRGYSRVVRENTIE